MNQICQLQTNLILSLSRWGEKQMGLVRCPGWPSRRVMKLKERRHLSPEGKDSWIHQACFSFSAFGLAVPFAWNPPHPQKHVTPSLPTIRLSSDLSFSVRAYFPDFAMYSMFQTIRHSCISHGSTLYFLLAGWLSLWVAHLLFALTGIVSLSFAYHL